MYICLYIYIYIYIFQKKLRNRKTDYNSLICEKYNWMTYKLTQFH